MWFKAIPASFQRGNFSKRFVSDAAASAYQVGLVQPFTLSQRESLLVPGSGQNPGHVAGLYLKYTYVCFKYNAFIETTDIISFLKLLNQKQPKDTLMNMDFYMQIAKNVGLKESQNGSNFLFSPVSIHAVLSMVAAGSSGQTSKQILSFLKSESTHALKSVVSQLIHVISADETQNGGPRLSFVNGIWVDKSFSMKSSFQETMDTIFKAKAKAVDIRNEGHEVEKEVNLWASDATNNLIKELLPEGSLDEETVLVLANALYFKGQWDEKFDPSETQDGDFYLFNGTTVQVPFMTSKNEQLIQSFDDFQVLKLPYRKGQDERRLAMYIFLPNRRDGLPDLVKKLSSDYEFLDGLTIFKSAEVGNLRLPKFKISFQFEASTTMKELGMVLPFSDGAELTEMVEPSSKLSVSNIFHKSYVEMNEEGTEAAAVTAGGLLPASYSPPRDFVADHPFMFMIREDVSRAVLFIGNVVNPSAA